MKRRICCEMGLPEAAFPLQLNRITSIHESTSLLLFNQFDITTFSPSPAIQDVPLLGVSPETSLGILKTSQCNVLPGSVLEVNTMFGMETDRNSHLKRVEDYCQAINSNLESVLRIQSNEFLTSTNITLVENVLTQEGETIPFEINKWVECGDISLRITTDFVELQVTTNTNTNVIFQSDQPVRFLSNGSKFHGIRVVSSVFVCDGDFLGDYLEVIGSVCDLKGSCKVETLVLRCKDCRVMGQVNIERMMLIMCENCIFDKASVSACDFVVFASAKVTISAYVQATSLVIQTDRLALGVKGSIVSGKYFIKSDKVAFAGSIQASDLFIESRIIDFEHKSSVRAETLHFWLLAKNGGEKVAKNDGILTVDNFVLDVNLMSDAISKDTQTVSFTNRNAFTVSRCLLAHNGCIISTGNMAIRSLYIASYAAVEVTKKGSIKLGDFMATEKNGVFKCSGIFLPYAQLSPDFYNSGSLVLNTPATIHCHKFVSDGSINGELSLRVDDLMSVSGEIEGSDITIDANMVAITRGTMISANNIKIVCKDCQLAAAEIKAIEEEDACGSCIIHSSNPITNVGAKFVGWKKLELEPVEQ